MQFTLNPNDFADALRLCIRHQNVRVYVQPLEDHGDRTLWVMLLPRTFSSSHKISNRVLVSTDRKIFTQWLTTGHFEGSPDEAPHIRSYIECIDPMDGSAYHFVLFQDTGSYQLYEPGCKKMVALRQLDARGAILNDSHNFRYLPLTSDLSVFTDKERRLFFILQKFVIGGQQFHNLYRGEGDAALQLVEIGTTILFPENNATLLNDQTSTGCLFIYGRQAVWMTGSLPSYHDLFRGNYPEESIELVEVSAVEATKMANGLLMA